MTDLIASAQCGDLRITVARIYQGEVFALRGIQREGEETVIVFDRTFEDEVEALLAFATAIRSEYGLE